MGLKSKAIQSGGGKEKWEGERWKDFSNFRLWILGTVDISTKKGHCFCLFVNRQGHIRYWKIKWTK